MKKFTLALSTCALLASQASPAIAPTVMVTMDGHVYTDPCPCPDKSASMPIAGVKIYLQQQIYTVQTASAASIPIPLLDSSTTDIAGHFAFNPITAGGYTMSFQRAGNVTRTIDVYTAKDTTMRVSLLAAGAHGGVQGKVLAACSQSVLAMPCVLTPLPKCTLTVTVSAPVIYQTTTSYVPIGGAVFTTITDDSGNYSIDSIPISSNNTRAYVTAGKTGYVSQSIDTGLWNSTKTTVNFTLSPNSNLAGGDSVYTTPASPVTKDSITYNFYDADACCCAEFISPTVSVSDTIVYLSFSVNTTPCQQCECFAAGKWYGFKGGALKAGKYGIYRAQSQYCPPGTACPLIALLPVRIGEVVVRSSSSAARQPALTNTLVNGMTLKQEKGTLTMSFMLDRPGHIRARVFNARGILAGELYNGQASSGTHRCSWKAPAGGVYFLSVDLNNSIVSSRTMIVSQ